MTNNENAPTAPANPAIARSTDPAALSEATPPSIESRSTRATGFSPGHPWYYLPRGDALPPLAVEDVEPASDLGIFIEAALPRDATWREHTLRRLLADEQDQLAERIARYGDIVARGAEPGAAA